MTVTSNSSMRLGLHTYSLYLHGLGQNWAGFNLPWERQLSTIELFDLGINLGLDGFHLDDGVLETLERSYLLEVGAAAKEKGLYLEMTRIRLAGTAPLAEENGIRLALENHCDCFSEEVLWVVR